MVRVFYKVGVTTTLPPVFNVHCSFFYFLSFFLDVYVKMTYTLCQGGEYMRIQVNLHEDVVAKLDEMAKKMGLTRSGLSAVYIMQGLRQDILIDLPNKEKKEP